MNKTILILGSDGMVGKNVFDYLKKNSKLAVLGTTRNTPNDKAIYTLSVDNWTNDIKKIPQFDIAINCIGALNNKTSEEFKLVNQDFPKEISKYLTTKNIKLIHISTDAVFGQNENSVNENSTPNPKGNYNEDYSVSKLHGEITDPPHITVRTSLLGIGNTGLIHSIINSETNIIGGYTNQIWSGCTTLQFAKLCEDIALESGIGIKIKNENLIHFAPIGPISKFEIVKNIIEVFDTKKEVIPKESVSISRFLSSNIIDFNNNPRYTNSVKMALEELKNFYTQ